MQSQSLPTKAKALQSLDRLRSLNKLPPNDREFRKYDGTGLGFILYCECLIISQGFGMFSTNPIATGRTARTIKLLSNLSLDSLDQINTLVNTWTEQAGEKWLRDLRYYNQFIFQIMDLHKEEAAILIPPCLDTILEFYKTLNPARNSVDQFKIDQLAAILKRTEIVVNPMLPTFINDIIEKINSHANNLPHQSEERFGIANPNFTLMKRLWDENKIEATIINEVLSKIMTPTPSGN